MKNVSKLWGLAVLASLSFQGVMAQSDEQVLNSAPIDVDGYLAEKPVTDGELEQIKSEIRKQKNEITLNKDKTKGFKELVKTTEKLSDTTEDYIENKNEAKSEIAEYNKKIECLTKEDPDKDCDKYLRNRKSKKEEVADVVNTAQAAPQVVAVAPTAPTGGAFEKIKLLPYAGVTNYMGEIERVESNFAGGLRLESNIYGRLSMGVGINYSSFTTQDFGQGFGPVNPWFGAYNSAFGGAGRQIEQTSMGFDLYAKFFLTNGERFRPYIGAGMGYNRMSMKYSSNNNFAFGGQQFGGEELNTGYINATLSGGSEIMITQSIGMNLELQYSRGFGANNTNNGLNPFNAPDQRRLQDLSNEIVQANALSIFAGLLVTF